MEPNSKQLEQTVEAILFYKGEPLSIKELSALSNNTEDDLKEAITSLKMNLTTRGITLIQNEDTFMLGTDPAFSKIIEHMQKEELSKDIGNAGLETLAIILYQGPISRRDIDHIRGVNSNFILRNLLIRGLIERSESSHGERSYSYSTTTELLALLGIREKTELPEWNEVQSLLKEFNKKEALQEKSTEKDSPQKKNTTIDYTSNNELEP